MEFMGEGMGVLLVVVEYSKEALGGLLLVRYLNKQEQQEVVVGPYLCCSCPCHSTSLGVTRSHGCHIP
jgi:hypothetical protein